MPFHEIKAPHFLPALGSGIARAKAALAAIKGRSGAPGFEDTITALELAVAPAYDVAYVFSALRGANGDDAMQALAKEIMPKLVELSSDINLDDDLFARVKAVHDKRQSLGLSVEKTTLVEQTFRGFKRGGALLSAADKQKLRKLDEELSTLGPRFAEHALKATNEFELVVTDEKRLAGMPASLTSGAAEAAKAKKKNGWLFTLQAPCIVPFLKYADDRELRREMWTAYNSRCVSGPYANGDLVLKIAALRYERAKLLGYDSHAHYQMEERMAEHPDKVRAFLRRLLEKARPAADAEMKELREYAAGKGGPTELMPWDYAYWANKLKEERYAFNAESLRPYFSLDRVLEGAFEHAKRLFGLTFTRSKEYPIYAEDVMVFEVKDELGRFMGLFYADFHPRPTKAGGAWCTRFKPQYREGAADHRPHVSIVCNFSKPTGGQPSLLTFSEVTTLFHEFGHALHSLLSKVEHRSLSCTSVFRDFVELPSQIMENWCREKEGLMLFARHHATGEVLPAALIDKLIRAENFHAGYLMLRQLRFAMLDMAWYGADPRGVKDVDAFERAAVKETDLLPHVPGTSVSTSFEHIFVGGYSAGYYGYKWAEVLDADAFELFKEKGIFDRDVATRFQRAVLERGGSEHPMRLYREFRGREPDPDALLRRSGLI